MQCHKVLAVIDYHPSGIVHRGISPNTDLIAGTLRVTGLARSVELFYCDIIGKNLGWPMMGEVLLTTCAVSEPDLLIFLIEGTPGLNPSRRVIQMIRDVLGIKVFALQVHSAVQGQEELTRSWLPFVSYMGFWDARLAYIGHAQDPKAIQGFTPTNREYFYDRRLERDIDVSFPGAIDKPGRVEHIQFLRDHGINVFTKEVNPFDRNIYSLSLEEYATIMSRSKITLHFGLLPDGRTHLKGRVFEITACKSLLVEGEGMTKEFFEEGKDFVAYRTKEELLEKVKYYLAHDKEREKIAQSGYRKTTQLYNATNLWGYTLSKMGFQIPESLANNKYYQELLRRVNEWNSQ